MKTLLRSLALLLVGASLAIAQPTKYPSDPIFIFDQQGRPIPGAIATITDLTGTPVVVWANINGTVVFNGAVPANGLLQFFGDVGYYRVTVSGAGITYIYYTQCQVAASSSGGDSSNALLTSIDRTAEMFRPFNADTNDVVCPADGKPCYIIFDKAPAGVQVSGADFIMPSYALTPTGFLISFVAAPGAATIIWKLDWCTYANAASVPCVPTGAHVASFTTAPAPASRRKDVVIDPADWPTSWGTGDHVVFTISRDTSDTFTASVRFENFRMEFTK